MAKTKAAARGMTVYSRRESGDTGNHRRAVRFDVTDGYVGITEYGGDDGTIVLERVLLSPKQWFALKRFMAGRG